MSSLEEASCAYTEKEFEQLQSTPQLKLNRLSRPSSLTSQPIEVHTC